MAFTPPMPHGASYFEPGPLDLPDGRLVLQTGPAGAATPPMPHAFAPQGPPQMEARLLEGTNELPYQRMYTTPVAPPEEGKGIMARTVYPMPPQIISAHAWARSDDCCINWTDPGSATRAHTAWLNHRERNSTKYPQGIVRDAAVPEEYWADMALRNQHSPPMTLTESNATPGATGSLYPLNDAQEKTWYNTYCYVNAHEDKTFPMEYTKRFAEADVTRQQFRQYLGDVPPHAKTYVDTWAQHRHASFMAEKREKEMRKQREREMIESGENLKDTPYVDTYSGEHLVSAGGQLVTRAHLMNNYNIRDGDFAKDPNGMDLDALRIPWPFQSAERNKPMHQFVYDWFDRDNPYIDSYEDYEIVELNSAYVDPQLFDGPLETSDKDAVVGPVADFLEGPIHYVDPRKL